MRNHFLVFWFSLQLTFFIFFDVKITTATNLENKKNIQKITQYPNISYLICICIIFILYILLCTMISTCTLIVTSLLAVVNAEQPTWKIKQAEISGMLCCLFYSSCTDGVYVLKNMLLKLTTFISLSSVLFIYFVSLFYLSFFF